MAEVMTREGAWHFDSETVRLVPGHHRRVHKIRQALGELTVPLAAIAGIAYEPGRKGGRLRLRLRDGADPFMQAVGGQLPEEADPYLLAVDRENRGAAEYFADEVRHTLVIEQVPSGSTDRYLMPGPGVPLSSTAGDGTVSFDGDVIRMEWNDWAKGAKTSAGPQQLEISQVEAVEWVALIGISNGYLRFRVKGTAATQQPWHDPNCITWGIQRLGGTTCLVAAAVIARLPHPSARAAQPHKLPRTTSAPDENPDDHDTLLRRLRELGDLHRDGVLTDDEFTSAKQALLRRF